MATKIYKSPEEMQKKIDIYFKKCDEKDKPYTISGLGLVLGLSRMSLLNYQNSSPEFKEVIETAKMRCENYAEEQLFTSKSVAGVIFNLKNNYGYKDKQDIEAEVSQTIKITPPSFD